MMRFSILHISDLHRDLQNEVDNVCLLDSIERDFGRLAQQEPAIVQPSICIVSGDLVYGVNPLSDNPEAELERQYSQAEGFLVGLAERLFHADRSCIVIVPGNHDVSYYSTMSCVEPVEIPLAPPDKSALVAEFFAPQSSLRWSWNELRFYRIADAEQYQRRFRAFARLYDSFYGGRRSFLLAPDNQHAVFDYPELGLCVLALNSCHNNDPLRKVAAFHPASLTAGCRLLRDATRIGRLVVATWHHSFFGAPNDNDYLDAGPLQVLIDAGVSLAFHGHQHRTDCIEERYRLGPSERKITLISAGTLCAGPRALRAGIPRGYNIVELDRGAWTGRLHHRQMLNEEFNLPVWGPGRINITNSPFMDFGVCPPLSERPAALDLHLALASADELIGSRKWAEALEVLGPIKDVPLARPLLTKAAAELGDPKRTIDLLWPPQSVAEVVCVGGAVIQAGSREEAEAFVNLPMVVENNDASVREIATRVRARRLR